jgi:hypothetical protein
MPMPMHQAESHSPTSQDNEERQRNLSELLHATSEGKKLASFRRVLGTLLVITAAPVMVLSRSADPTIRRALTILALVWLAMVLPMVRLLCVEWQNRRVVDRLHTSVYGRR